MATRTASQSPELVDCLFQTEARSTLADALLSLTTATGALNGLVRWGLKLRFFATR
jgi:hypothetical protein